MDDDKTIRMVRPAPRSKLRLLIPAVAVLLLAAGSGVWIWSRTPVIPPVQRAAVEFPLGDEAAILAARAPQMLVFRFRDAPSVLVLSFPSLQQQGDMLDRVAAFVEKAGLPRDRVLADAELDAAIRQAGDTRESYYYGHDYRAADLARFFATADRDGITLNPEEIRLRALVRNAGALISIPPVTEAEQIDESSRAAILHHELSHGVYFTDAAYAAYARSFWQTALNDAQRDGFRRFLGGEGYDTTNEDLMLNEAQAYLIHTRDRRYFLPDRVGLTEAEAARLRAVFIQGMPDGWLKAAAIRTQ